MANPGTLPRSGTPTFPAASVTPLAIAVIASMAADPGCGQARQGSDLARRIVATAVGESRGDPYAIGINADPARGLTAGKVSASTEAEALANARTLLAQGRRIDLGLMQISDANLTRHGLTLEIGSVFDACRNMRAGTAHLADDFRAVWTLTSRRYNCGYVTCGADYARGIDAIADQIQAGAPSSESPPPIPVRPDAPPAPVGLHDAVHRHRALPANIQITEVISR